MTNYRYGTTLSRASLVVDWIGTFTIESCAQLSSIVTPTSDFYMKFYDSTAL